jgi:nicotinic acid mononucleotide adenylyltransferase
MEFIRRAERPGSVVALVPGAWNPPTRAHAALAAAALDYAEEAVFVLPRALPHKEFDGPPPAVRASWIAELTARDGRFSAALSEGGLFVEMAREARAAGAARVLVACGADAAERIVNWAYPAGEEIERQLEAEYEMLVAPRIVTWQPPERFKERLHWLRIDHAIAGISSTQVREAIARGGAWRELVPEELEEAIGRAYGFS